MNIKIKVYQSNVAEKRSSTGEMVYDSLIYLDREQSDGILHAVMNIINSDEDFAKKIGINKSDSWQISIETITTENKYTGLVRGYLKLEAKNKKFEKHDGSISTSLVKSKLISYLTAPPFHNLIDFTSLAKRR